MKRHPAPSHTEGAAKIGSDGTTHGDLPREFEGLARLARGIARAPFASISLTGVGETWCVAAGAAPAFRAAEHPFFTRTLSAPGCFVVPDAQGDSRFCTAPGFHGPGALRGYAGWPLRTERGEVLGALALYDTHVLNLSEEQQSFLGQLARQCGEVADLRARIVELELLQSTDPKPSSLSPSGGLTYDVLDNAPIALYYVDASRDIDYCNSEYRSMFGLGASQRTSEWAQGVHPEDLGRVREIWADFCAAPRPMSFEYRALRDGGEVRFYAEQVQPEGAGYVGTISDLTDLVTARGELHKIENLFRNMFDQAPIGVAFADAQGRFQLFNEALCTLLGYPAAELGALSMDDLTHPEERAQCTANLERLWSGMESFIDFEKRYRRKDGTFIWVRSTTAIVRDGERKDCCVEYLRDITHRKLLTAQLLEQRTLLEAVIGDLPVALIACDVSRRITHYNRAAVELHCVQANDARSSNPAPLAADVYLMDGVTLLAEDEHPLARALRGEVVSNLELTIVPHSAAPRTTLSSARRLVGPDGRTLGAVAVVQDTTERKAQEMELERVNKELMTASREAGMAEVATNVLHNVGNILNSVNISASLVAERLRQSKAAGVSRLASLLLEQGERAGQFIAEDPRGKRVPEYLAALGEQLVNDQRAALDELTLLRENLEHIKDTVTMQQSYAKLCGVNETVEVVDLVEDSLRLNAGAFARHGVTLRREFAEVPRINVDKHKVLQILVNLVRNAKYACDDSGRADKLITLRVEPAPAGVRIAVIDNGIGIPAQNMRRLFQHGFTTRPSGHGFGLHSGALAAQELGGTLRAESEGEGRGACFTLELPLSPPKAGH